MARLAERALAARRVAVDGPDAAGKTTLADELAGALRARGRSVLRLSIDDFLRPPRERYRRGHESPEGYYLDSFDHDALRGAVLAASERTALVDGVFLLRPELTDLWDLSIFVNCERDEILRRATTRDAGRLGAGVIERYRRRYLPAQDAYRRLARPLEAADVVIDNTDPASPRWGQTAFEGG